MSEVRATSFALSPRMTPAEECLYAWLMRYPNEHTRRGYERNGLEWLRWCTDHDIDPLAVTRVQIEFFTRGLEAKGLKRSTIASKQNALAGYYRYAVIDEYITKNPMLHVNRVTGPRESSTEGLTARELYMLLNAAEEAGDTRLHAVMCLLGLNGMRISEVLGIDLDDIGFERGYTTARIHRKGGKTQTLPLPPRAAWAVQTHTAKRTDGPLFITSTGARLSRNQVGKEIKTLARDLGIKKRVHPHSFRHTFVSIALDAGVPIRDVQNSTGHADSRLVSYYDRHKSSLDRNAAWAVAAQVAGQ